jgi:hypothetical protein
MIKAMNTQIDSFLQSYSCQDIHLYPQIAGALINVAPGGFVLLSSNGIITAKPPG